MAVPRAWLNPRPLPVFSRGKHAVTLPDRLSSHDQRATDGRPADVCRPQPVDFGTNVRRGRLVGSGEVSQHGAGTSRLASAATHPAMPIVGLTSIRRATALRLRRLVPEPLRALVVPIRPPGVGSRRRCARERPRRSAVDKGSCPQVPEESWPRLDRAVSLPGLLTVPSVMSSRRAASLECAVVTALFVNLDGRRPPKSGARDDSV